MRGFHGRTRRYPDSATIGRWVRRFPGANVALRLPPDVIGIDVDAYDGKAGAKTLRQLERDLGPLPETWISTSRKDGISGIRLYRVPPGLSWSGKAGPGIDLIHAYNRYVIAAPSIHPTGRQYKWNHTLCPPDELPELPEAWAEFLGQGADSAPDRRDNSRGLSPAGVRSRLTRLQAALREHGGGEPCEQLAGIRDRALRDMAAGGSAHDAALAAVWAILQDFGKGHQGANAALWDVRQAFTSAPGPRKRARDAVGEWTAMFRGIATPRWASPPTDPCSELANLRRMLDERRARNARR